MMHIDPATPHAFFARKREAETRRATNAQLRIDAEDTKAERKREQQADMRRGLD